MPKRGMKTRELLDPDKVKCLPAVSPLHAMFMPACGSGRKAKEQTEHKKRNEVYFSIRGGISMNFVRLERNFLYACACWLLSRNF